ncbi:hypothetical protein D3C71_2208070 [compost metagenome]
MFTGLVATILAPIKPSEFPAISPIPSIIYDCPLFNVKVSVGLVAPVVPFENCTVFL